MVKSVVSKESSNSGESIKSHKRSDAGFSAGDKVYIEELSKTLSKQVSHEATVRKFAGTGDVLKLVGMGAFAAASIAMPGLPKALKPFIKNPYDLFSDKPEPWERFNIPYLKRTLKRLEKRKLVKISEWGGEQIVEITDNGRRHILRFSLDSLEIKKPKSWDGRWRLVAYDVPTVERKLRDVIKEYLEAWGFYPFQQSLYLHAYPCGKEVTFLREYLGAGAYIQILVVSKIENDAIFRKFFGV